MISGYFVYLYMYMYLETNTDLFVFRITYSRGQALYAKPDHMFTVQPKRNARAKCDT